MTAAAVPARTGPHAFERTPDRPGPGPLPETLLRALDLTIGRRIEGMLAGRRTVVPGVVNKVVSTSGRYTPRTVLLPLIDRVSKSG